MKIHISFASFCAWHFCYNRQHVDKVKYHHICPVRHVKEKLIKFMAGPILFTSFIRSEITHWTRLHSSRMRTARALTVSHSMLARGGSVCSGGECLLQGGLSALGGCVCSRGVSALGGGLLPGRGVCSGGSPPRGCLLTGGVSAPGVSAPGGLRYPLPPC